MNKPSTFRFLLITTPPKLRRCHSGDGFKSGVERRFRSESAFVTDTFQRVVRIVWIEKKFFCVLYPFLVDVLVEVQITLLIDRLREVF